MSLILAVRLFLIICLISPIFSWSPTNSYAPGVVPCSGTSLVRNADSLYSQELSYIQSRRKIAGEALLDFFERVDVDFEYCSFLQEYVPTVGLAFSGGGYRAMLAGAGTLAALDSREPSATEPGHLGGLLQSSTYITGLSGGSWLLGSVYLNNFTTISAIRENSRLWNLENSLLTESSTISGAVEMYRDLLSDTFDKCNAGFKVSLTDIWGRALSRQMIDLEDGGPALQWSDMSNWKWFQNAQAPYPIIVANARMPLVNLGDLDAAIMEITPFELGSFDPSLYAFTPLKYLGTRIEDGQPVDGKCYSGFDNAGFMFGTSSSVFDLSAYRILQRIPGLVGRAIQTLLDPVIKTASLDVGIYDPNPFYDHNSSYMIPNIDIVDQETLYLVDGGEDDQVIPLQPLIHPSRQVDVVFAFDYDTDTSNGWPNGNSIIETYSRQFKVQVNHEDPITFPYVPDKKSFINEGLTSRPTFFGCSAANQSSLGNRIPPLVVYIANYPYSYWANTSTFKLSYSQNEMNSMIKNGYNMATLLNGTLDDDWPACVACAIVHRENERRQQPVSSKCQECLSKYCWNGQLTTNQHHDLKYFSPNVLCWDC